MFMTYLIITVIIDGKAKHEKTDYVQGTVELEKFTDNRILNIYPTSAIYKLYRGSECIPLREIQLD